MRSRTFRLRVPGVAAGAWPKTLALAVFALALWSQTNALVGVFFDDGIYVVLAKALAQGHGYRYIHLPGAPAAVHYPPLYPAALSLLWRVWPSFPSNVALFQVFDSAALGVAAWLIAAQCEKWQAPAVVRYVFLPAAFAAFPLLTIVGVRFSEPFFLALSAAAVFVADHDDIGIVGALLGGMLAGLAALTRSIGVVVVAGVALGLWLRGRRPHALAALTLAALMLAPWFLWIAKHAHEVDPLISANYGTYATAARQAGVAGFLASLDLRALAPLGRLVVPGSSAWIRYPLSALLFAATMWGGARVARDAPAAVVTVLLYIVIVTLWPWTPDRFMWVVVPWMAVFAGLGLVAAWNRRGGFRAASAVGVATLLTGYVPREIVSIGQRGFAATAEGISQSDRLLVASIDAGTPAESVIAAEGEPLIYLYTGRLAVPNAPFQWKGQSVEHFSSEVTRRYFCEAGVTHVALSSESSDGVPIVKSLAAKPEGGLKPLFSVSGGPSLYHFQCRA